MEKSELLRKATGRAPRVFIVWEPVLDTDWDPPNPAALARVTARHFWDQKKVVAQAAQPVLKRDLSRFEGKPRLITGDHVWDYVAVYPPGVQWGAEFPLPAASGAPIVDIVQPVLFHSPRLAALW